MPRVGLCSSTASVPYSYYQWLFIHADRYGLFRTNVVALRHVGGITKCRTLPEILKDYGYNTTCIDLETMQHQGDLTHIDFEGWGASDDGRHKAESLNAVALPELERLHKEGKPFMLFMRHMDHIRHICA